MTRAKLAKLFVAIAVLLFVIASLIFGGVLIHESERVGLAFAAGGIASYMAAGL
jgi:preprotein translocase subunit SecG